MQIPAAFVAFLGLLVAAPGSAEPLVVPDAALRDAGALEASLPELAQQAQEMLPADPLERADYRFRAEFARGRYESALAALAEWQRLRPAPPARETVERYLRQELHARAKVIEARDRIPYGESLKRVVDEKFATFDDRSAADSAWVLALPPFAARRNLNRELQKILGRRDLTPAELMGVLEARAVFEASTSFAPALDAAIAMDDARRFSIDRGVLIRTKDGATLAADVVRPKRLAGPLPAVMHFTIYANPEINIRDAKDAAVRGYAAVFANSRGKYLSTDRIVPWETEVWDTWEVVDWISRQPWSNGKVGMFGHSYGGFAQWAAAKSLHPALKTIVPSSASFPGNGMPMQNNVFLNAQYAWPLQNASDRYMGDPALGDRNRWNSLLVKWFESGRPLREIDSIDGTPNPIQQEHMRHPSYDRYWQAMQPNGREFAKIDIPVLSLTGYFDDAGSAAVNYLVEHHRHRRKAEHYLVIGPYSHLGVLTPRKDATVNGYTIDPVANIDTLALVYQWFDYVLRGAPKPALLKDRINYQVMGSNTWGHAPSIAKMADRTLRLYLTDRRDGTRYVLADQRPAADGVVEQRVDFADRKTWLSLYPATAYLETPDAPTHVTYVSAPFGAPCSVSGLITGELKVSIDRRDFDFTWSLYEAMPDGKLFNLSYYLGRASYAKDWTTRRLLEPGRIETLPFSRTPLVSRQISKGSRLVLLLTVNKNPWAQVNHGSGKDVSDESIADAASPLNVRWHNGSFIDVPLRETSLVEQAFHHPAPRLRDVDAVVSATAGAEHAPVTQRFR
jgi:putative CocE/NonD family hydrolase